MYCYFCRKFKNPVRRVRLHFGEIYVCEDCARELVDILNKKVKEVE